ncbi:relaxase, partial [Salmonella enterica]|nr:relaxase [Salmonella enterica]
KDVATTDIPRESISEKIAELELRLIEDRRNEIVEKILQKNAVKQQKHLRFVEWLSYLKHYVELLRSFGKTILHKTHTTFSTIYTMKSLNKARKIRL